MTAPWLLWGSSEAVVVNAEVRRTKGDLQTWGGKGVVTRRGGLSNGGMTTALTKCQALR